MNYLLLNGSRDVQKENGHIGKDAFPLSSLFYYDPTIKILEEFSSAIDDQYPTHITGIFDTLEKFTDESVSLRTCPDNLQVVVSINRSQRGNMIEVMTPSNIIRFMAGSRNSYESSRIYCDNEDGGDYVCHITMQQNNQILKALDVIANSVLGRQNNQEK